MTSLAVRWIAYVSQDETTEVPMRFRTTNWLTEHDNGQKTFRRTPLMQWIVSKKSPIPQYLMYNDWQTDEAEQNEKPIHLWIQYRIGQPIPFDIFTETKLLYVSVTPTHETVLQYWLRYRKNEPVPAELMCNKWWNPQIELQNTVVAPTLFSWIQYCQGQSVPPEELLQPLKVPKKSKPHDYRTFVYNHLTPLQMWIKHRPNEDLPDYLIYDDWDTDISTVNIWLQYRPDEPITQRMTETIGNTINNIEPNDYTCVISLHHLIENFIQFYNYPIEEIQNYLISDNCILRPYNLGSYVHLWIQYKKHKDLPEFLQCILQKERLGQDLSDWIQYRQGEPLPDYICYAGWEQDYLKNNHITDQYFETIVDLWIQYRPKESIPDSLLFIMEPLSRDQRISLIKKWLKHRIDEPIPNILKYNGWNQYVSGAKLINTCIEREGPFIIPEELLQYNCHYPQSPQVPTAYQYWIELRPFEIIPEILTYPGCEYGKTFLWVQSIVKYIKDLYNGKKQTIVDNTAITVDGAYNCLHCMPTFMKYPGWNTQPVTIDRGIPLNISRITTPIINYVQAALLSSDENLVIPDDYLYPGSLSHIITKLQEVYIKEHLNLIKIFEPTENLMAANIIIDDNMKVTEGNCCICYIDANEHQLIRMCANNHTENAICLECYYKLYYSQNKHCPLCGGDTLINYII